MTIIVPTDFSENSRFAADYACQIAVEKGHNLHLLHCYTSSSVGDTKGESVDNPLLLADQKILELQTQLVKTYPQLHISIECSRSLIIDKLTELSQSGKYALIVMGASGASQSKPVYWGSTTVAVASKSEVPVVVIPNHQHTFDINHAALLTNFKSEELDTLKEFQDIVGIPNQLTLIHVFKESQKSENVNDDLDSWVYNIREMGSIADVQTIAEPINKDDVELDTVPEVVSKIISEVDPQIILITPSRKTFFERLFKSSVSKAIALELSKPAFFDKI